MTVKILNDSLQLPMLATAPELPDSPDYKVWLSGQKLIFGNTTESIKLIKSLGYENIVIIDSGGNGDYETLSGALAAGAILDNYIVYIFGDVLDSGAIDFFDSEFVTVCITPGAILRPTELYAVGSDHTIVGPGLLAPQGAQGLIPYNPNMTLTLRDLEINNVGGRGLDLTTVQTSTKIVAYNTVFQGTYSVYAGINKIASASRFVGCTLIGTLFAPAPAPWSNAPFYHCVFNGTVTNVTAAAGTANGSNIVIA